MKTRNRDLGILLVVACSVAWPAYAMESTLDTKAYYNRGTDSYEKGDYAAAIQDLSTAITLEPNAPDAYFNRGLSYRRRHQNEEAITDFSKAIRLNQTQASYYFERCNVLIIKKDLNGAIADCSEALRLSPDEASGYMMRGVAHLLKGDLEKALFDSVEALQIDPAYSDARKLLYETLVKREVRVGTPNPSTPHNTYFAGSPKEI